LSGGVAHLAPSYSRTRHTCAMPLKRYCGRDVVRSRRRPPTSNRECLKLPPKASSLPGRVGFFHPSCHLLKHRIDVLLLAGHLIGGPQLFFGLPSPWNQPFRTPPATGAPTSSENAAAVSIFSPSRRQEAPVSYRLHPLARRVASLPWVLERLPEPGQAGPHTRCAGQLCRYCATGPHRIRPSDS
jgi:hypothetical protein